MTQTTSSQKGPFPAPELRYRFTISAEVAPGLPLDTAAAGELSFIPITGGAVIGDLQGSVVPGGGDWCLKKSPGSYRVEARYGIRTAAGSYVDVHNTGILVRAQDDPGKPDSGAGEEYFMTTPVFRTVDPQLAWLTESLFAGRATAREGATVIDVFELLLPAPASS